MESTRQMVEGKVITPGEADSVHILVYTIDGFSYGLQLSRVVRIVRAVAVTPVPDAAETILGVINLGLTPNLRF